LLSSTYSRRLCAIFGLFTAILIAYSQTWAFTGDEGFHLLAAQSILRGMRPWIDFCFPQAPMDAYWNAAWMALLGQSWRVVHLISALLTAAGVALLADYAARIFPIEGSWRLATATAAGLLAGLNAMVFGYGPLGQAYGLCLLLTVAAFRMAARETTASAAAAGLLAGAAAAASLLTAPIAAVLWLWYAVQRRWSACAVYLAAAAVPWLPVAWLFLLGPKQSWFNLVEYHAKFRRLYWPETTQHDLEVLASWIDSGQALVLGLLALGGLAWTLQQSDWPRPLKRQIYLSGWIALAICAALAVAHPTFPRYYMLAAPFVAIPAAIGLYVAGSRLFAKPAWPLAITLFVTAAGLGKSLYDRRVNYKWTDYEDIARKIERVTPAGGDIFANEILYFVMRRQPDRGLEFYYDRLVPLPPDRLALLHITPQADLDRRLTAGAFATVYICEDEETYSRLGLDKLYRKRQEIEDCVLFSGRK
jgi:hypothetical protein